ncbi:hypothetical protein [Parabacteroides sp. PF5-9]|uniref:hypothetical protein n=1 Tax=Parabacteroides sp. PF5-9 TaxID=1742404 RepID=UPI002476715F|nr:hypothetical protein [Parabacteroides sp. PF5-9]MDH6357140.1 hypothetical protein [Parabacteroides sp. PF5-9]
MAITKTLKIHLKVNLLQGKIVRFKKLLYLCEKNSLKSKVVECELELYLENENVNIYSIRTNGEKLEIEKFLEKFPPGSKYEKDINIILAAIKKIISNGALERYFRPEGAYGDGIGAIPIEGNRLRLYCIRVSNSILVIGNGDVKQVKKWQECPILSQYVEQLKKLQEKLNQSLKDRTTTIMNKNINGRLKFNIK